MVRGSSREGKVGEDVEGNDEICRCRDPGWRGEERWEREIGGAIETGWSLAGVEIQTERRWALDVTFVSRLMESRKELMNRLMDDFQPLIIPSTLRRLIEGHKANIKCIDTLGPGSNLVISGSRSVAVFVDVKAR